MESFSPLLPECLCAQDGSLIIICKQSCPEVEGCWCGRSLVVRTNQGGLNIMLCLSTVLWGTLLIMIFIILTITKFVYFANMSLISGQDGRRRICPHPTPGANCHHLVQSTASGMVTVYFMDNNNNSTNSLLKIQ